MATTISKGTMFPEEVVNDLFNKVRGKSSLAVLANQIPVSFVGNKEFTFSMDDEVNLVGENEAKAAGQSTVAPVTIVPVKVEYGSRVSDEFMNAAEEQQLEILKAFNEGFAKKVARGIDIMAFHGVNPRTGSASGLIKTYFDQGSKTVTFTASDPGDNVEDAVEKLGDNGVSGIAMSRTFASALAKMKNALGGNLFPELAWGGNPEKLNGLDASVNTTVDFGSSTDEAIVGNFREFFKWGFAKDVTMKIIEYGDPDNTGSDLAGHNQIYIRGEAYVGWAIMDQAAFTRIVE